MSKNTAVIPTDGGHVTVSAAAAHAAKLAVTSPKFSSLAKAKAATAKAVTAFVKGATNLEESLALSLTAFLVLTAFDKVAWKEQLAAIKTMAEGYSTATVERIFSNVRTIVRSDVPAMMDVARAWRSGEYTTTVGAAYSALTAHRKATGASNGDGRGKGRKNNKADKPTATAKLSPTQFLAEFLRWDAPTRASILATLQKHHSEAVEQEAASMAGAVDAKLNEAPAKASRKRSRKASQ